MTAYFIVDVRIPNANDRQKYDEYIEKVKPIVEKFGGKYVARSEQITTLSDLWSPDRFIIIEFRSKDVIIYGYHLRNISQSLFLEKVP